MLQPKLTKVEPVKPLKLCLYYETGEVKLFDAAPLCHRLVVRQAAG